MLPFCYYKPMKKIFDTWLISILDEKWKDLKKPRTYPHFDATIKTKKDIVALSKIFLDKDAIIKWNFLPFIHYNKQERKYNWNNIKNKTSKRKAESKVKNRSILYASHRDAILYSWYAFQLNTYYEFFLKEEWLDLCVWAYRQNNWVSRSNITLSDNVIKEIKSRKNCAVLTFDITKFYDTLNKVVLKNNWSYIINNFYRTNVAWLPSDHYAIFKSIFYYSCVSLRELHIFLNHKYHNLPENIMRKINRYNGYVCYPADLNEIRSKGQIYKKWEFIEKLKLEHPWEYDIFDTNLWIPQWSPISPVLANIYLSLFDKGINTYLSSIWGIYRRYADDILIICDANLREHIEDFIYREVKKVNLNIQAAKTDWFIFSEEKIIERKDSESQNSHRNLQYLWFEFDWKNTFIRWSSISRYYQKMRSWIRRNLKNALKLDPNATIIRNERIRNNFLVEKFARYTRNSAKILWSPEILRQLRNAEKNIWKFQVLAEVQLKDGNSHRILYGIKQRIKNSMRMKK